MYSLSNMNEIFSYKLHDSMNFCIKLFIKFTNSLVQIGEAQNLPFSQTNVQEELINDNWSIVRLINWTMNRSVARTKYRVPKSIILFDDEIISNIHTLQCDSSKPTSVSINKTEQSFNWQLTNVASHCCYFRVAKRIRCNKIVEIAEFVCI